MAGFAEVFDPFLKLLHEPAQETQARQALEQLCEKGREAGKGFDPKTLAFCLNMIRLVHDAHVTDRLPEPLRYGDRKNECLTTRELHQIAKQAQKLQQSLLQLRLTNFAFEAQVAGRVSRRSLLTPRFTKEGKYFADVPELKEVANLPALWRWCKAHSFEGTDASLWRVCQYVEETTGKPNDSLVVDILGPLEIAHCTSPDALKNWRARVSRAMSKGQKAPS